MNCFIFIVLFAIVHQSFGVIYRLNDSEYLRMPPLYHLDDYNLCLHQPNGTYCSVEFELVSDSHSDLMQMINEYSEHWTTHFNHTQLHYGICLAVSCSTFLLDNRASDKKKLLEECLNDSMWRDYTLKTRVIDKVYCQQKDDPMNINALDISAAVFFSILLIINVIGSLYDVYFVRGGTGNRFVLCFSIRRNLTKLMSPESKDPCRKIFKSIHGLRTLSIVLVIMAHSPLGIVRATENAHDFELKYDHVFFQLIFNGTVIVQTFFMMTGFLMAYFIQDYAEKNETNWLLIPKGIMMRWIRLTPTYAVVLIFICTWMRFTGSGPFWENIVSVAGDDCRRNGWLHMIYMNNYINYSQCMLHTWYLAADTQLYTLGLVICALVKNERRRKVTLYALFVIGVIAPSLHTYFQDLDGTVLISPQTARHFLVDNPTFNHSYKRGHTNMPGFILGLALGFFIYKAQKDQSKIEKYRKYGVLYTLTVPAVVGVILLGMVFYSDGPRAPLYVRTLYAAFPRPVYGLLGTVFFVGVIFKHENVYRRILEWRGWRVPSRVSYCAYLVHEAVIRIFVGMNTSLWRAGVAQLVAVSFIFFSFVIAFPLWLLVESPISDAIITSLGLSKTSKEDENILTNVATDRSTSGRECQSRCKS